MIQVGIPKAPLSNHLISRQLEVLFFAVYIETGRQTSAGNIQINIGAGAANQIRTWKVTNFVVMMVTKLAVTWVACLKNL